MAARTPGARGPRARLRAGGAVVGHWARRASYLQKWVVLATLIGIIAGLGAVLFYSALRAATHLSLDLAAGYHIPRPVSEGAEAGSPSFPHGWLIPLVVCAGGLLSGVLVSRLAPEAEGHGTDAAIEAVHRNPRMVRTRAVAVKLVASAITIGSGGSGGREGPTAQISAGFGSLLARTLDLSPEDGRVAVSVGIGSGIGAIFGAPLGGAVLAGDIVYRDDFEVEALVPGLISSVIGYTVWGLIEGFSPMFGYVAPGYRFTEPIQLAWFALIGICAGLVGLAYAKTFYGVAALSRRLPMIRALRPAVGGLFVGLLALAIPQVLGTGYGWVQHALGRGTLLALPLWLVLALPFAKIVATALSIGTGGSGGIFGPGMVIGAFTGAAVWRLLESTGAAGVPHSPAPFVIVAMMACFGGIARAPLSMMLMVAEMTGSLTILAPAMVAVGLSYLIVRRSGETIYRSQLRNREEAQAARLRSGLPLLGRVPVAGAMAAPRAVLDLTMTAGAARDRIRGAGVPGAPVVDAQGLFCGTVGPTAVGDADPDTTLATLVDATAATVPVTADLDDAVDALPEGHGWLTVLDDGRRVRGILAISDVVRAYHEALRSERLRIAPISTNAGLAELTVGPQSPVVGRHLGDRPLPPGTIVISVRRRDTVQLGLGALALEVGDVLTVLASPDVLAALRALLTSGSPPGG